MTILQTANRTITVEGLTDAVQATLTQQTVAEGIEDVQLHLTFATHDRPPKITLTWEEPIVDIQSRWTSSDDWHHGNPVDWANGFTSRATSLAPVVCFHNVSGQNRMTFAFSDALNPVRIKAGAFEETAAFKCSLQLFTEPCPVIHEYSATIRFDARDIPYYEALHDVQCWWAQLPGYTPGPVPDTARLPMYSTWYSFHQELETGAVEEQCRIAKSLGCDAVIEDDGWQTCDNNRGYAFCGDWNPDRIPAMREHVARIHDLGMKFMLWYSVPFVGIHSKAWAKFQGKFLNPQEPEVRTLDPRYPDVREYLITQYEKAVREWDLDGLKLDFVDSITFSKATDAELAPGRDYASVPEGADRLLSDVIARLRQIKPDIMIEFRQGYIGPLMRKYGNMFRAGDCPNDSLTNRIRTIDVRLLCGETAAHADMLMWHNNDPVESAALQILNILFSVPQISVKLDAIPADHQTMVKFWLSCWRAHRDVLLGGTLMPLHPEEHYPVVLAATKTKLLATAYADHIVPINGTVPETLLIVNGKLTPRVVIDLAEDLGPRTLEVRDCCGNLVRSETITLSAGLHALAIPSSGLARLTR
jgi:alpha-galactosidase